MPIYKAVLSTILITFAAASLADVTVTMQTEGKASFIDVGGESVVQFKGQRQRTDQMLGKRAVTLIIDVDGKRFIDLDAKKKSALVTPLSVIGEQLTAVGADTLEATLTKTAQTKQVAGFPCTVHDVRLSLPFSLTGEADQGMELDMALSGTVCLSTAVPGLTDYQAFYRAAADSGFVFGDPRSAKSPTGAAQARAYAALTRKMSEAGMALESNLTISATGEGPLAGMMGKLAASNIRTTVTNVTSGELPADMFEIPADFKVKTQK
jgi:hypothetical protein